MREQVLEGPAAQSLACCLPAAMLAHVHACTASTLLLHPVTLCKWFCNALSRHLQLSPTPAPWARRRGKEAARLRGDIALEGREYAGRRSSRAAVFGGEDEGSDEGSDGEEGSDSEGGEEEGEEQPRINGVHGGSSSEAEEDDQEEGGSSSDEEDDADRDIGARWLGGDAGGSSSDGEPPEAAAAGSGGTGRRAARRAAAVVDGDHPSGSEEGDEGSEDEEGRGGGGAAAGADDEMAALEREYEAMQQVSRSALGGGTCDCRGPYFSCSCPRLPYCLPLTPTHGAC